MNANCRFIVGRQAKSGPGEKTYGINPRKRNQYLGETEIMPKEIFPLNGYSNLYLLKDDELSEQPFNWMYCINEDWLKYNKNQIFDYSHANSKEFDLFVKENGFSQMAKIKHQTKERNQLLTQLVIPFESVDRLIINRTYQGFNHSVEYIKRWIEHEEMNEFFRTSGIRHFYDYENPKSIEFILRN